MTATPRFYRVCDLTYSPETAIFRGLQSFYEARENSRVKRRLKAIISEKPPVIGITMSERMAEMREVLPVYTALIPHIGEG